MFGKKERRIKELEAQLEELETLKARELERLQNTLQRSKSSFDEQVASLTTENERLSQRLNEILARKDDAEEIEKQLIVTERELFNLVQQEKLRTTHIVNSIRTFLGTPPLSELQNIPNNNNQGSSLKNFIVQLKSQNSNSDQVYVNDSEVRDFSNLSATLRDLPVALFKLLDLFRELQVLISQELTGSNDILQKIDGFSVAVFREMNFLKERVDVGNFEERLHAEYERPIFEKISEGIATEHEIDQVNQGISYNISDLIRTVAQLRRSTLHLANNYVHLIAPYLPNFEPFLQSLVESVEQLYAKIIGRINQNEELAKKLVGMEDNAIKEIREATGAFIQSDADKFGTALSEASKRIK
jgi:hypothetical protein